MTEIISHQAENIPLKCLVVDDEPMAREGMADLISKVDFLYLTGTCASAMEAKTFMDKIAIDVIFLDINMPYLSGLDFLESLEESPLIVLTTAYPQYALDGYRFQVVDYLLKPIAFKRFYQAALNAQQTFRLHELAKKEGTTKKQSVLYVKQGDAYQRIVWEDILYIEGMQNYVKIHFPQETKVILQTITSLEEMLPKDDFFRVHKSYLVNVNHIDSIEGGRIFIGKRELPISRHRKNDLLNTVVFKSLLNKNK
ncbi:MAG: LytTR family DNA-binding domain-containing protein [Tannerellaceae bacterium]|jgi:DNA-binding LytR/AlgR family response regulator|nr:LytTR family DNA-binding domain-containing protein [Tannerellaceae bacterium]